MPGALVDTPAPGARSYKCPTPPHSAALPGRQYSVLGLLGVLFALALFELSPAPAWKLAVAAPLFLTWAGIKISMAVAYRRQANAGHSEDEDDAWTDSASEDGCDDHLLKGGGRSGAGPPSCFQRFFREYYLFDQTASAVPRAVSWFCFLALVLMALLQSADPRWQHKFSMFSCFSESCCRAAQEVNWDANQVQCERDMSMIDASLHVNSTCVMPQVGALKEMCAGAAAMGWRGWSHGTSFWWGLAIWFFWQLKEVVLLSFTPLPQKPTAWTNDPQFLARIGAVIPCHRSEAEIGATCRSIMHYLPPQNIVVVDNANSPDPPDNTRAAVHEVHPDIAYVYNPIGLKTLALYTGMLQLPGHVEYLMHMDDDTVLPDDMVFDETWFEDPSVAEITYPIFTREVNLLTSCLGFIFKLNSHSSVFSNATSGTALWAPGIIGLVRRSVFMKVLPDHVFLPFGEDAYHGTLILSNNYKIKRDARSSVVTFAPPVFFTACASSLREQGYGAASLFKQRAQRWMVTQWRRTGWTFLLLFTYQAGSLWGNVWFRIMRGPEMLGSFLSLLMTPALLLHVYHVALIDHWQLLLLLVAKAAVCFYVADASAMALINFVLWRHRPDYQVHWGAVIFTPIVKMFLMVCKVIGHILCVIYWMPFVPTRVHVFTHNSDHGSTRSSSEFEE